MLIEERDYRIKAGHLHQFVRAYQVHGLELQKAHLGKFIGYFTTELGELNHVVALWGYESLDHRLEARDRMMADPAWQNYLEAVVGLVDTQHTRILRPTTFSPIQ